VNTQAKQVDLCDDNDVVINENPAAVSSSVDHTVSDQVNSSPSNIYELNNNVVSEPVQNNFSNVPHENSLPVYNHNEYNSYHSSGNYVPAQMQNFMYNNDNSYFQPIHNLYNSYNSPYWYNLYNGNNVHPYSYVGNSYYPNSSSYNYGTNSSVNRQYVHNRQVCQNNRTNSIPICTDKKTQTNISNVDNTQHFNFNSVSNTSNVLLPIVEIKINGKFPCPALFDTGSSVSLINKSFFNKHKHNITYRNLARKISITTINSVINYDACITISFKIGTKFFNTQFYVIEFPKSSKFDIILSYEFVKSNDMIIVPNENHILYKNVKIPLLNNVNNNLESNVIDLTGNVLESHNNTQNSFSNVNLEVNNLIDNSVDPLRSNSNFNSAKVNVMQTGQSSNNVSSQSNHDNSAPSLKSKSPNVDCNSFVVKSLHKAILQPNQETYIKARAHVQGVITEFIFEPSSNSNFLYIEPALYNNDDDSLNNNSTQRDLDFYVLVKNLSNNDTLHINKNQRLGSIFTQIYIKSSNNSQDCDHVINLIEASSEVLNQRIQDFDFKDFQVNHLSPHNRHQLQKLLSENAVCFSKSLATLGHCDRVIPNFKFTSDNPIRTLPIPIPYSIQDQIKEELNQMQQAGIISRTTSEWSSPLLVVKKKGFSPDNPKYRLVADFRLLNSILINSSYPLPNISILINQLARYKYFCKMDFQSAYWQLNVPEEARKFFTVSSPFGQFSFNRLPFGLKTSASYFQFLVDSLIEESALDGIFSFQDDFIIASNSFEDTLHKLRIIFNLFKKYNLTLSPAKCSFHVTEVEYLGFYLKDHKIYPTTSNILKITEFPLPSTQKKLRQFLGLVNFYRNIIPNFSKIISPLLELTSPKTRFNMQEHHIEAFNTLQKFFFSKPFIIQPNFNKEFFLATDGSCVSIAGILMQYGENNILQPVSYFSKVLNKTQRHYPPIKIELMAIVFSVRAFRTFLYNRKFTIISDAKSINFLKKSSNPSGITTRWLLELAEYQFNFQHIPGKSNVLADFFSRTEFPNTQDLSSNPELINEHHLPIVHTDSFEDNTPPDNLVLFHQDSNSNNITNNDPSSSSTNSSNCTDPPLNISNETLVTEQLKDANLLTIINLLRNSSSEAPIPPKYKGYILHPDNSLLLYCDRDVDPLLASPSDLKIVVPESLKYKALQIAHHTHMGIKKTYEILSRNFFWSGYYSDTIRFVSSCTTCMTIKPHTIPKAPLQDMSIPKKPGELISIDLTGPFSNNQYVLTIIDNFSRHLELYPMSSISSNNVIKKLFHYICSHGRPSFIKTDQGTQFKSTIFQDFVQAYKIKLNFISVAHPESNSLSEIINKAIKSTVKSLMKHNYNFEYAVHLHKSVYNSLIHPTLKMSPNLVHFGRDISTPMDMFDNNFSPELHPNNFDLKRILETSKDMFDIINNNIKTAQRKQNDKYNEKSKLRKFFSNDIVYIRSRNPLKPAFDGPYRVIKRISEVSYVVQWLENIHAPTFVIHVNRLCKCLPRPAYLNPPQA